MPEFKKERYWGRYAAVYDDYAELVMGKGLRLLLGNKLSRERDLGELVEFGCGTGYFTKAIAQNARRVLATDLSDEMLGAAKANLEEYANVAIEKADCEGALYPPESFDAVLMANVLHVIENPEKALRECFRILKQGGLLIAISYTDYGMNWYDKVQLGLRYFLTFGMPPQWGLRNFSPEALRSAVEGIGFEIEELELIGEQPGAIYLKGRKKGTKPHA
jgi:ABC-2 type transport system ATP-binding protein